MTDNEKLFRQKVEKLTEVYVAKNKDYGDSFSLSLDKYGILASLIRMGDKMNRIDSLYDKPTSEVDESLVDSLEDLANYAIMTAIWLEKQVEDSEVDYTDSTFYVSDDPYFTIRKYSDGRTENITYFDDDFEDDYDDLFDDDFEDDDDDDDIDAFLDMLSNFDSGEDTNEGTHTDYFNCGFDDECTHDDYFNFGSEDDESEDDPDDFIMDGSPKFRIIRRPKGGLSRKDFWDMIRDLHDEEGD